MVERNHERFNSEKEELANFLGEIRADDVVYDIGANTGLYSLFAANECPDGNVIAFEPYPPNLDLLKQDISRNGFEHIEVIETALSNSVGTIGFSQPNESDIGYGSSAIGPGDNKDTIEVPTTTGDQLIDDGEIPPPNVVKIDVEGAEPLVIDGLERALSAPSCRVVFCEVHLPGTERRPSVEDFDSSATDIQNRFEEFGFTAEKLPRGDRTELFYKFSK
jgi:FkbM family methyltransferase